MNSIVLGKSNETGNNIDSRIPSIDIFRYLCSVMVVAVHTHPLEEFSQMLGFVATDIIPSIAVPFFSWSRVIFICQEWEKIINFV